MVNLKCYKVMGDLLQFYEPRFINPVRTQMRFQELSKDSRLAGKLHVKQAP